MANGRFGQIRAVWRAVRFVDYEPTQLDVQVLLGMVVLRDDFVAPDYDAHGAITQLDSFMLASSHDAAISVRFVETRGARVDESHMVIEVSP
jgi:hypothetical protein